MDFFAHQDIARKQSGRLVALFILAVVFIIVAVYLVAVVLIHFLVGKEAGSAANPPPIEFWQPQVFLTVTVMVLIAVGAASLMKILALRQGGSYVAESLGGTLVSPETSDNLERRLRNVVEEIAIASGVPVPAIYVLYNEPGINAFAAGWTTADAAVAVTEGALKQLNRDELQGVIAHEFSHILNGDMRLNIRLVGLIAGIMVLATIGYWAMHVMPSRRGKNNGAAAIMLAGVALLIIGYGGAFVARLIQAAVSRQREYLADSSAVQFTRNPAGIANALKKIGGYKASSVVHAPAAREVRHMFFSPSDAVSFLGSAFATHPPLDERIRRLDPAFEGDYDKMTIATDDSPGAAVAVGASGLAAGSIRTSAATAMASMGVLDSERIAAGATLLSSIPDKIREAVLEPLGACATVTAMLLDEEEKVRQRQLRAIETTFSQVLAREALVMAKVVADVPREMQLPLLDLALPALRQMSRSQYVAFSKTLVALVRADNNVTLFEFCVQKIVEFRLFQAFESRGHGYEPVSAREFVADAVVMISAVARAGDESTEGASNAYRAGLNTLFGGKVPSNVGPLMNPAMDQLDSAFMRFSMAPMKVRQQMFLAVSDTVIHDGQVTLEESELIRAIAYSMSLPLPPFVVSQAA